MVKIDNTNAAKLETAIAGCIGCAHAWPIRPACEHERIYWLRLESYEHVGVCAFCRDWVADWDAAAVTADQVKRALDAVAIKAAPDDHKLHALPSYARIAACINQRIRWFAMNQPRQVPA